MPLGLEVTVPVPVPVRATVSRRSGSKTARTVRWVVIDTVQVGELPLQSPPQLTNT